MTTLIKFYQQKINVRTNSWTAPRKSVNIAHKDADRKWCRIKPAGMEICGKIPFAINKIERWHRKRDYRVLRQEWVSRGYKVIRLIISEPKTSS